MTITRRRFLHSVALGSIGAAAGACVASAAQRRSAATAVGRAPDPPFTPDVELAVTAAPEAVPLLPGAATRVWRYSTTVLNGPSDIVQPIAGSYLAPTIRLRTGQKVRIRFRNQLPESTILHLHGLHVPERMDGHPRYMIDRGREYLYDFELINRAGMYWYHPHHHTRTGLQVYNGLAGVLLVSDPAESALALPSGAQELLCVIQDRDFDANNQLTYLPRTPMAAMTGFLGSRVLVNGQPAPTWRLTTRVYRLRLLNGSNSRVYKLAWSDGTPMRVIGSDGGLLERPTTRPYLTLIPGERADVILDLRRHAAGARFELRSLEFSGTAFDGERGRGGRGRMGSAVPSSIRNGAPLSIARIAVERGESPAFDLPDRLSSFDASWLPDAAGPAPARVFSTEFARMRWLLNGRSFEMDGVAPNESVGLGTKEVWEFDNRTAAMRGMRMAHPLHLHGRQFRVLSRDLDPAFAGEWDSLREGVNDEGWRDTVLVMPGERVRILVHFLHYTGMFLYHCHNLEHEDMGMMRNYRVAATAG